jgi:hypothetical protein
VLGFWWADGNIFISLRKSGQRRYSKFSLHSADYDHLIMIAGLLGFGGQIRTRKQKRCKKMSLCYTLEFSDIHIVNRLLELGGKPRKSFCETKIPSIPDSLFRHFVRGFFDGDGSIYYRTYKNRHNKMTSALASSFTAGKATGKFLELFRNKLRKCIPVGNKKISRGVAKKLAFNQYDTMLLCDWMYQNATVFLNRKKKIWDGSDKTRLMKSKLYFSNKV